MKARQHLPLLLLCVAAVHAQQRFTWNGGTTLFSDPLNWRDGQAPPQGSGASFTPCSTTAGSPDVNIISNLDATEYKLGEVLMLPPNGVLQLASDGTVLTFTDLTETQGGCTDANPDLLFTAGSVPDKRNDFYCHENWAVAGSPAGKVPCFNDIAAFPAQNSYYVNLAESPYNNLVALNRLEYDTTTVTSASNFNPGQLLAMKSQGINLLSANASVNVIVSSSPAQIRADYCQPLLDYSAQSACECYSSCPTPEMILQQQANFRANFQSLARSALTSAESSFNFVGSYTSAAVGVLTSFASLSPLLNQTALASIASQLQASLVAQGLAVTISSVRLVNNATMVVSGVANMSLASLPGSPTSVPNPYSWTIASTAPSSNNSKLATAIQLSLVSAVNSLQAASLTAMADSMTAGTPASVKAGIQSLSLVPNFPLAVQGGLDDSCMIACTGANCDSCLNSVVTTLTALGISGNVTFAAQTVIGLRNALGGGPAANPTVINPLLAATAVYQQLNNLTAVQDQVQSAYSTISAASPQFYVGRSRSLLDQLLSVQSNNAPVVAAALQAALLRSGYFQSVSNMTLRWIAQVPAVSGRRRAAPLILPAGTPSAVAVIFSYTLSCAPGDAVCAAGIPSSGPQYMRWQTLLSNTFDSVPLSPVQCLLATTGPNAGQLDPVCLQNLANVYYTAVLANTNLNATSARAATQSYIFGLLSCGFQPSFPNGTCLSPPTNFNAASAATLANSFAQSAIIITTTTSTTTTATTAIPQTIGPGGTPPPGTAASSGGGGGGGLGLAAAGAGGGAAIIIVIVIIIIMRKRKQAAAAPKTTVDTSRTVVAFENPLYDDPKTNNQPLYDATASGNADGEGLYDEPAFTSKLNKSNPLYSSQENLGGPAQYEDPGQPSYGYLDINPNKGPEAGEYLEQMEQQ